MENGKLHKTDHNKIIARVSCVGILGNIVLSAFKLYAGIAGRSGAMVSDAVHSISDIFATLVAFIGVKASKRGADERHPYGHGRMETIAAMVLAAILIGTGWGIGVAGLRKIFSGSYDTLAVPGVLPMVAALVSILMKEAMFWYTRHYAKMLDSAAFMADAWHHRSDAMSSIGSFVGILGARLGWAVLDPIASVIICLFILKAAFDILKDALQNIMESACSPEMEKEIEQYIMNRPGIMGIDLLKTRLVGNLVYVDVEITVDGSLSLTDAHQIAEDLHDDIERTFPQVTHIMVHENPG